MKKLVVFIVVVICVIVLPIFFKFLRYDFVKGGGNLSSSSSKEEAITRNVFVCDLEMVSCRINGNNLKFEIEQAWVEKIWRDGAWYWTTKPLTIGFTVMVKTTMQRDEQEHLNILNNKTSALGDYEGLGYCCGGQFSGTIRELPDSDTIKYSLLRDDNLDFRDGNIIGELTFVLKRIK